MTKQFIFLFVAEESGTDLQFSQGTGTKINRERGTASIVSIYALMLQDTIHAHQDNK